MAKDTKELFKFVHDFDYREKVLTKVQREAEKQHKIMIKMSKDYRNELVRLRQNEIDRIENSRWEVYANGKLKISNTEGIVLINGNRFLFSDIHGAELNISYDSRSVTLGNSYTRHKPSLGGAIVGGIVAGKTGAVIGGALVGKEKTYNDFHTKNISTCNHIGVVIDISGFAQEVSLLDGQKDLSSYAYSELYENAQNIILRLRQASTTPVPESFIPSCEMESVKEIDQRIDEIDKKLDILINSKPEFKIPDVYRTEEQAYMSDEEYLEYLCQEDERSISSNGTKKNEKKFRILRRK